MPPRKKKDFHLAVLEEMEKEIQPLLDSGGLFATKIKDEQVLYHLIDNDKESNFFFTINDYQINAGGEILYFIVRKPYTKRDLGNHEGWVPLKTVKLEFDAWIEIIKGYEKAKFIYDDPILQSYQEKFEKKFEIIDDDANTSPFDLEQQVFLDKYLDGVQGQVKQLKVGRNEEEQELLTGIENDVSEIKKNLTKESKKKIVQRLSRLWAKAQKVGLDVLKEIFVNVSAEIIKKLMTGA